MRTPWSDQKTTDHFLQSTQELYNSNNSALMRAWAAAGTAVLEHKNPSFSSKASNHETSHNSLCRLTNYLLSHWKALSYLPELPRARLKGRSRTWENCKCGWDNGTKRQSGEKSLQNNSNKSESTDTLSTQLVVLTNISPLLFPQLHYQPGFWKQ